MTTAPRTTLLVLLTLAACSSGPSAATSDTNNDIPPKSAKRGIAYDLADSADFAALAPGVSWWYNWGPNPNGAAPSDYMTRFNMEYDPMLWNFTFDSSAIVSYLKANPSIKYLLVLNEPNITSQANVTPDSAAKMWPRYEAVAQQTGVKIVGPAITWGDMANYQDPVVWLDTFIADYQSLNGGRSPEIDYLAFHWYDFGLTAQLDSLDKYGKPIWVTEFANWDSQITTLSQQETQMQLMVDSLEQRSDVFRYSWFTGRWSPDPHYTSLLGNPGQLTGLGTEYIGLPH
jgi:Glycosyl hydrolase catalytic core